VDLPRLARALIINTVTNDRIEVMYNPDEYKLDQGNNFAEVGIPGLAAPPVQYVRGRGRTLSMDLFFDTYGREPAEDVRKFTNRIVALLDKVPQLKAPPVLLFTMGQFSFECVLVDAAQRFTMFQSDGTPVRSMLSVKFQEFVRVEIKVERGLFVGPPTLHNLAGEQTLSGVAAQLLGDASRWREIADANGVDDPFRIPTGTPLVVPGGGKT
jgi:nucleoid-associated protein YgaU